MEEKSSVWSIDRLQRLFSMMRAGIVQFVRTVKCRAWQAVWVLLLVTGCGGSDGPEFASVSGTVTWQGKPLSGAQVAFAPETGGKIAQGVTDSDGGYRLFTIKPGDGALVGKHRVTIVAREKAQVSLPGYPTPPAAPRIPEKYFDAQTSELTADVQSGSNTFDFTLP
jgi:hypothetical protein